MTGRYPIHLSRRERQILEALFRLGRASAAEVTEHLTDAPTLTTVRGLLRILEQKGHVRHEHDGVRYVYAPIVPKSKAGASALLHVIQTFFDGSPSGAMAALLGSSSKVSNDELRRLTRLLDDAMRRR
jgi:predicted transcriptional regulator